MSRESKKSRKRWGATALLVVSVQVAALQATAAAGPAYAAAPAAPAGLAGLPSAVPAAGTPNIDDGVVYALTQVGAKIIAGGSFTKVSTAAGQPDQSRTRLLAFDAATGALDPSFAPVLDGEVRAVTPGPVPGTVYVAGTFTSVSGVASKAVALLDTATGQVVPGFVPPAINGAVWSVRLSGGRLIIGGTFTKVGGKAHGGLATLNATTGKLDPYLSVQLVGHHNYQPLPGYLIGGVGPRSLDISPDGTRMIVVGNFTSADGLPRDQIAVVDLGASATVDLSWATLAYAPACYASMNDSYMRGVSFSPDGSFFVVATTGGYAIDGTSSGLCDGAARFETAAVGQDVQPTWYDLTGGDSLESVTVTDAAVYVGGHMRWMDNPFATWDAEPGAVPRPGLAALDPVTGVPLAWNPGRNPRGAGAYALLATPQGLYVGSDTSYIGNRKYLRGRVAYFPTVGGRTVASAATPSLPVRICVLGTPTTCRSFDGTTVGPAEPLANPNDTGGVRLDQARLAFTAGDQLFAIDSTGGVTSRRIVGGVLSAPVTVDPFNDPAWASVRTGFPGGQTYRGVRTPFLGTDMGYITSAFFASSRFYVTVTTEPGLTSRGFSTDSGLMDALPRTAAAGGDLSQIGGAFVVGGLIYVVSGTDGTLHSAPFSAGTIDASHDQVVSGPAIDGIDWRVGRPFVLPAAGAPAA
jgi:hypothetical protein